MSRTKYLFKNINSNESIGCYEYDQLNSVYLQKQLVNKGGTRLSIFVSWGG